MFRPEGIEIIHGALQPPCPQWHTPEDFEQTYQSPLTGCWGYEMLTAIVSSRPEKAADLEVFAHLTLRKLAFVVPNNNSDSLLLTLSKTSEIGIIANAC
jgi:hypothetical protein